MVVAVVGDPHVPQRGIPLQDRAQACHDEAHEARHRGEEEVEVEGCRGGDRKRKEDSGEGEDDLQGREKDGHGGEEEGEGEDGEEDRGEEGQGECHCRGEDRGEVHGEVVEEGVRKWCRRTCEQYVSFHPSRYVKHTELHHNP